MPTNPTDTYKFIEYLKSYYPGMDVSVNMRTRKYRSVLSGLWHWDVTVLEHSRSSRGSLRETLGGKEYHEYIVNIKRIRLNWKSVEHGLNRL